MKNILFLISLIIAGTSYGQTITINNHSLNTISNILVREDDYFSTVAADQRVSNLLPRSSTVLVTSFPSAEFIKASIEVFPAIYNGVYSDVINSLLYNVNAPYSNFTTLSIGGYAVWNSTFNITTGHYDVILDIY